MRNPLTPEAFVDWCEKQPADATYNWYSINNCAIKQYVRFLGGDLAVYGRVSRLKLQSGGEIEHAAFTTPWTFSALAKRIREELRCQK